jgi:hypothetical protein
MTNPSQQAAPTHTTASILSSRIPALASFGAPAQTTALSSGAGLGCLPTWPRGPGGKRVHKRSLPFTANIADGSFVGSASSPGSSAYEAQRPVQRVQDRLFRGTDASPIEQQHPRRFQADPLLLCSLQVPYPRCGGVEFRNPAFLRGQEYFCSHLQRQPRLQSAGSERLCERLRKYGQFPQRFWRTSDGSAGSQIRCRDSDDQWRHFEL